MMSSRFGEKLCLKIEGEETTKEDIPTSLASGLHIRSHGWACKCTHTHTHSDDIFYIFSAPNFYLVLFDYFSLFIDFFLILFIFYFTCCLYFFVHFLKDRVSWILGWLWICYIDMDSLELLILPVYTSPVLGLQGNTTTLGLYRTEAWT